MLSDAVRHASLDFECSDMHARRLTISTLSPSSPYVSGQNDLKDTDHCEIIADALFSQRTRTKVKGEQVIARNIDTSVRLHVLAIAQSTADSFTSYADDDAVCDTRHSRTSGFRVDPKRKDRLWI